MASFNTRVDRMTELLNDQDILIGLGDGGAHLDMLCDSGYPTYLLGTWVRERKALTLEEAVRRMTSDPADFFGIRDRGRLAPGLAADIAIFDPATVGSVGPPRAALRPARRREAHGDAPAGHRVHDRQRRSDSGEGRTSPAPRPERRRAPERGAWARDPPPLVPRATGAPGDGAPATCGR